METQKNTKICSCCGRELEPKYFHRTYSTCKICISQKKHEKYRNQKGTMTKKYNSYREHKIRKAIIERLRERLEKLGRQMELLSKKNAVNEYIDIKKQYSMVYYQLENLNAI